MIQGYSQDSSQPRLVAITESATVHPMMVSNTLASTHTKTGSRACLKADEGRVYDWKHFTAERKIDKTTIRTGKALMNTYGPGCKTIIENVPKW